MLFINRSRSRLFAFPKSGVHGDPTLKNCKFVNIMSSFLIELIFIINTFALISRVIKTANLILVVCVIAELDLLRPGSFCRFVIVGWSSVN